MAYCVLVAISSANNLWVIPKGWSALRDATASSIKSGGDRTDNMSAGWKNKQILFKILNIIQIMLTCLGAFFVGKNVYQKYHYLGHLDNWTTPFKKYDRQIGLFQQGLNKYTPSN